MLIQDVKQNEFILSGKMTETNKRACISDAGPLSRYPKRFQNVLFWVTCVASPHRIQSHNTRGNASGEKEKNDNIKHPQVD